MKLTELIEKRIDENVASYDLGTLESYKYLIEMIAIEYHNEQLRLYGVVRQSEQLCDCAMPEPINPWDNVDKDTCRKCNSLIA